MRQRDDLGSSERIARDKGCAWSATGCLLLFVAVIVAVILATRYGG